MCTDSLPFLLLLQILAFVVVGGALIVLCAICAVFTAAFLAFFRS